MIALFRRILVTPLALAVLTVVTACDTGDSAQNPADSRFDANQYERLIASPEPDSLEGRWLLIGEGKLQRKESAYVNNVPRLEEEYQEHFKIRQIVHLRSGHEGEKMHFISCDSMGARPVRRKNGRLTTTFGAKANPLTLEVVSNSHMLGNQIYNENFSDTKSLEYALQIKLHRLAPDAITLGSAVLQTELMGLPKTPSSLLCFSESVGEFTQTNHNKTPEDPEYLQSGATQRLQVVASTTFDDQDMILDLAEIRDNLGVKEISASMQLNGKGTEDAIYSFWKRGGGSAPSMDIQFEESTAEGIKAAFSGKADTNQAFKGDIQISL
ncbi:Uncharacterised protein [BD1-7 clade bacterium]|uniref:Lipocalin-like domain-containing protein n=1 Tax=BD1-7 clade bacterium TaxID=2029982 RepID=A0A5S9NN79_9GAMM|nr:Uncharacterised protein [BD1-7 clade bacterium]CAA0094778.1 Uncharacterised protein [BD1-7 clade bacterium]